MYTVHLTTKVAQMQMRPCIAMQTYMPQLEEKDAQNGALVARVRQLETFCLRLKLQPPPAATGAHQAAQLLQDRVPGSAMRRTRRLPEQGEDDVSLRDLATKAAAAGAGAGAMAELLGLPARPSTAPGGRAGAEAEQLLAENRRCAPRMARPNGHCRRQSH